MSAPVATAARTAPANPRAAMDVRRTLLALLASALGVVPLSELIIDSGWLIDVWLTMLVVIGPAALLRLRRPPSAGQIWVGLVLLVPWLTARFLSDHAILRVIPTTGTWHDLADRMSDLHHTTTVEAAPVHSTAAVRLALCMLLGLVAALVDLVAVVGRRGALGGVPLLVVFTISGAVPREPVSWWLFAIAAAGFLILLALDSGDDLHRWGHYVPRETAQKNRAAATGQRIAVAAIALAVVLPAFVPSDSRNLIANLFHNSSSNGLDTGLGRVGGTGGIDPFISLQGQLTRKTPTNLFNVTVQRDGSPIGPGADVQPFYARTNVLSRYTGTGWEVGSQGGVESINSTEFEATPGTSFSPSATEFSAHISVTNLSSNPPVFAVPTAIDNLPDSTDWSPQDLLLVDSKISPGDSYDLTVEQPTPSVDMLAAATASDPAMAPWLQLPTVAKSVRDLVARLTATAESPYARAHAISSYFTNGRNGFRYSLATKTGDSGDELVDFLQKKVGYCQQYAAAMGVMLRVAGVPSRVVLGYTHAVPAADGTFTVTTNDAHSWVEAYFAGIGWIPFDPTPLAGITGGSQNDLPWARHSNTGVDNDNTAPTISKSTSVSAGATTSAAPSVAPSAAAPQRSSNVTGVVLTAAVLVALALLLLVPWTVRERRRRGRLRRARHGDTDALWAELSDTATDLGYVWSAARTPRQVAQWLAGPSGTAADSLRAMAGAVERTRYAPGGTAVDGRRMVDDLAAVRAGLLTGRSLRERVRAGLFPPSLGWRILQFLPGRRRGH